VNTLSGSSVLALQVNMVTNGQGGVTLNQLNLSDSGTGNAANASVSVVVNGSFVGPVIAFSSNVASINLNNYALAPNVSLTVQVYLVLSTAALNTYQVSVASLTGYSGNNGGQPISASPIPLSGYTVNCQQPTTTPTNTPTSTLTFTNTFTPTATSTITTTITPTFTFTITATGTITATSTKTPVPITVPVIYPNPVDGTSDVSIRPPAYTGNNVKVEIYTVAFRKVFDQSYPKTYGNDITLHAPIADKWNNPLASGLYYVVVTTNKGRSIGKMLILR
jgi:hypothetical protein